jgi:cell division protein FtsQ
MRRLNPTAQPKTGRKTGGAKPRRRAKRRINWRLLWRGRYALAAALLLGLAVTLWQTGWIGRQVEEAQFWAYDMTARAGLAVDDVLVEGRKRTASGDILAALQIDRGLPILAFDLHLAKTRLEALPWVKEAEVERRLPGWIFVHLHERQPLARWQLDGKLSVIDLDGKIIAGAEPERFAELPLVVGNDAPPHAADLLRLLESEPDLRPLVLAAVRVGGRRWNLRLEGDIDVRLPEADAALAWAQLAKIERQQGVLQQDVRVIDLRLPDRLIVRKAGKAGEDA